LSLEHTFTIIAINLTISLKKEKVVMSAHLQYSPVFPGPAQNLPCLQAEPWLGCVANDTPCQAVEIMFECMKSLPAKQNAEH
jgi:hypothetical protein